MKNISKQKLSDIKIFIKNNKKQLTFLVGIFFFIIFIFVYFVLKDGVPKSSVDIKQEIKDRGAENVISQGSNYNDVSEIKNDYDKDRKIIETVKYIRNILVSDFDKNSIYKYEIYELIEKSGLTRADIFYTRSQEGSGYVMSVKLYTEEGLATLGNTNAKNKENQNKINTKDKTVELTERAGNFFYMPAK
jgi:hypothetical protein